MVKNKKLIFILIFLIFTFIAIYYAKSKTAIKEIHYHAGFLIYVDGSLQDFSSDKYMNQNVCRKPEAKLSPKEELLEKAHLRDGVGDVVHVHRQGGVWGDLFRNINFPLPKNKVISGYQNNRPLYDILNQQIKPYESIIIIVGNNKNINLQKYVSLKHIKEVENRTESCGSNNFN